MKVILPVAGIGSRLKPHTYLTPKALLTVAGAPLIDYIIHEVELLFPEKIVFIIGHLGEMIQKHIETNYPELPCEFRFQHNPEGLGQAIYLGLDEGDKEVLIILGDTLFETDLKKVVQGEFSSIGTHIVEDARRFGVVIKNGLFITEFLEKPDLPPSNEAIVGIYWLKNGTWLRNVLKEMIQQNERVKGEFQLTTALQKLVEQGCLMTSFDVQGWFDCGKVETLLETNRYFLQKRYQEGHKIPTHCLDTVIIPPVSIASTANVRNSIIGPYVSIGADATVCNSILRNCIVENSAKVNTILLSSSIIGPNAKVEGSYFSLNISDSSEFKLQL
ncbi:MAG: sugar phosphate nucleotidyltransferase [bacterium]|nr:sugar phosphate nucleotidyltransferase [bacterium]